MDSCNLKKMTLLNLQLFPQDWRKGDLCLGPLWSSRSILPASMIDILARDDIEDCNEEVETDKDYHELL